ncbi:aspartic peptidase A1 [Lentinula guzmanii]|uniref:Aspartic peptidase A1 n=1 Tax=Lentinula guzmanii TaxID=2804957 RepID=A0AA38MZ01_9AGAR|nr:aspartic peptidase A1 [Lentinula guzmanii]
MRSFLIPLSLIPPIFDCAFVSALTFPFHVRTDPYSHSLSRRDSSNGTIPLTNTGNAQYIANVTLGGEEVRLIIDTGRQASEYYVSRLQLTKGSSSDLWVNFPSTVPTTSDTGKSLSLSYAIGSAGGDIHTVAAQFGGYTVNNQAFLLVTDASSFGSDIHDQGYDGLIGLGPNEGSQIYDKLSGDAGDTLLNNIFSQSSNSSNNFISLLLNRHGDPGQNYTGQMTIAEYIPGFENVTSMPKIDVESVLELLGSDQHWQALTDKNNGIIGPDGQVIQYDSIVPKAPDGQLVVVFDSGFTFNQVPRDISDAIYGRVQGAIYDSTNEWWTVPCGQMLNVSLNFGGVNYPIHPLDTVDDNFGITSANGTHMCIGSFQPITTAFSLLGNYDMIMGMSFLRNVYAVLNYGDWADDSSKSDPFLQLLSTTNVEAAHNDFVQVRMGGVDTTSASQWALLPSSEEVHSPVSEEEKKKEYQEMILSRWPYIFVGCLVFVLLVTGLIIWRCCCRKGRKNRGCCCCGGRKATARALEKDMNLGRKTDSYLPLQEGTLKPGASLASFNHSTTSLPAFSGYGVGQGKDNECNGYAFPEPVHVGGGYR